MTEITVHVTCDISKRILTSSRHNLLSRIKQEFHIKRNDLFLQVWDKSWDDWIDVEPLSVPNKSKLKVVFPKLPAQEIKQETVVKEEPSESNSIEKACLSLKDVSKEYWRSPYMLPKLSCSLEQKLCTQKQLRFAEKLSLVDELYEDMITYTRYPRSSHYHEVVTALLENYPYLATKANIYETKRLWISLLRKRFKERRSSQDTDEIQRSETSKNANEEDEDNIDNETVKYDGSFKASDCSMNSDSLTEKIRNSECTSWMKFEYKKKVQDREKVVLFMAFTFAERRNYIIHTIPRVSVIKEIYPFLFHEDEVKREYERIIGQGLEKTYVHSLQMYCHKIVNLTPDSSPLKQMTMKCMVEAISEKERRHAMGAGALFMIPGLLKEDLEDFIYFSNMKKKKDCLPRIECSCTTEEAIRGRGNFKVFVENILLCEPLEVVQAFECLSSCYFIFNIAYPPQCEGTLETLQILFLQVEENKDISEKAKQVITKLESK